jgi:hypothetical protein
MRANRASRIEHPEKPRWRAKADVGIRQKLIIAQKDCRFPYVSPQVAYKEIFFLEASVVTCRYTHIQLGHLFV